MNQRPHVDPMAVFLSMLLRHYRSIGLRPQLFGSEEQRKLLSILPQSTRPATTPGPNAAELCDEAIERARQTSAAAIRQARPTRPACELWRPIEPLPRNRGVRQHSSFGQLMHRHPDLALQVLNDAQQRWRGPSGPTIKSLHRRVIWALIHEGVGRDEYPFNTKTLGYGAMREWLRRELRWERS